MRDSATLRGVASATDTTRREVGDQTRRLGQPVIHDEARRKVTAIMEHRQVAYLDLVAVAIRVRHFKEISRTDLIGALIEFMEQSDIDFTQFATVEAMVKFLRVYFSRLPRRGRFPLLDCAAHLFVSEDRELRRIHGEASKG